MKISLLSENLQKKLLFVNHAISSHGQLPILSNFLIEAKKGILSIRATDLEIGINTNIPAKIEEEGITTTPAKTFSELISIIPSGKITLVLKKEGLELLGEKIKTVFQVLSPEDFPKLYENIGEEIITIKKEFVDKEFKKVVFAASLDTGRPALSGVLIKERRGKLLIVATDGYRLSLKKYTLENKEDSRDNISLLVPSRVIKELILMGKETEEIKIYAETQSNQIIFLQNEITLVGRLIEAEFPNYEKIIPAKSSTKIVFDKEDLQKAIKTCYIFAREAANMVNISIKKDKAIVSSNTPSVGENTVEIDVKTTGEEAEIAFNARYLLDLFSNIDAEVMSFEMTDSVSPGVFKIEKDDSFLHLIMPIRVQTESPSEVS